MNIDIAAKLAGMSINEFKELNPAFNLPVYAHKNGRQMLIPAAKADKFEANLAKWDKPLLTWEVYTPPADTSASQIASEHGMSAGQLLAANNLSSGSLKAGQPVLVAMSRTSATSARWTPPIPRCLRAATAPPAGAGGQPKAMPVPSVQPAEAKPVQVALASPAPAPAPRQDIKPAETVAAAPAAISADADGNYTRPPAIRCTASPAASILAWTT